MSSWTSAADAMMVASAPAYLSADTAGEEGGARGDKAWTGLVEATDRRRRPRRLDVCGKQCLACPGSAVPCIVYRRSPRRIMDDTTRRRSFRHKNSRGKECSGGARQPSAEAISAPWCGIALPGLQALEGLRVKWGRVRGEAFGK